MKLNKIISLEPFDGEHISIGTNVTKIVASIVVTDNRCSLLRGSSKRNEVREFYIVHDDTSVHNIYDATSNLHNFESWDPERTFLYRQLANACMVDVLEENFNR
jgi:hypothetical protein